MACGSLLVACGSVSSVVWLSAATSVTENSSRNMIRNAPAFFIYRWGVGCL